MALNFTPVAQQTLANQAQILQQTNSNFATLATLLQDAYSISGQTPNQMQSTLDMNSNPIINLPAPLTTNSPARLIDVVSNPSITVPTIGTSGTVVGLLNTNNTYSGTSTFSGAVSMTNTGNTVSANALTVNTSIALPNIQTINAASGTVTGNIVLLIPTATFTITFPASPATGQMLFILSSSTTAFAVNSATSNISNLNYTTTNALFPATAGKWAILTWTGSLWQIIAAN